MNPLPVTIAPKAANDIRLLAVELRPGVLEHLTRIGVDYESCSGRTAFPHPPGLESGLWFRYQDGRTLLLEVLFFLTSEPEAITIRRVLVTPRETLPDWVLRPSEWSAYPPWPVIDL